MSSLITYINTKMPFSISGSVELTKPLVIYLQYIIYIISLHKPYLLMKHRFYKIFFILFISFFSLVSSHAQRSCGTNTLMEKFYQKVPEARNSLKESIELWKKSKTTERSLVDVTIPVHVIIVHPPGQAVGTEDNLSMERIESQIEVLNRDFAGINSDIVNVPSEFPVGRSNIQFCLATIDPSGNPTNGVTRYATDLNYGDNNFFIMEQTIWDNSSYLNIYVTSTITDLGFSPVASAAYTIPPMWDAPTVLTSTFGGPGYATLPLYDLGRTTVHEIGHWLGLNHLWGPMSGGCSEDDGLDDTPIQEQSTFGCPTHPQASCSSPAIFFMNFMDYVNDDCMLAFSADQVDYMHFIIEQARPGLINAHLTKCENIVVPDPIVGTILSTTNESCSGSNDGAVNISASGGTAPYSYSLDGGTAQATGSFNNVSGGNHSINITDALNATGSINFNIDIATPILIEVVAVTKPCGNNANGSFGIVATGGNPGGLTITVNQNITNPNNFFDGLAPASYSIQAADSQACVEELIYNLELDNDPFGPVTADIIYPAFDACETNPNSVSVQFITDPADGINNITLNNGMTANAGLITGLSSGDYTYTASSPAGCQESGSFVIDREYYYDISFTATPPSCGSSNDGGIIFMNETDLQISVVMSTGTSTGPTSYANIGPGIHSVSVYGFNNCLLAEETIDFSINEIDAFTAEINPDCESGLSDFRISGSGGTGQLNYTFNGITNTTGLFEHVDPGVHQVIVSDQNNCSQAVLVEIQGVDAPIMVNANIGQELLCFGEKTFININVQGGAPPFEYILNGISQTGPFIDNLGGGSYELLVRSASDCAEDFNWEVEVIENEEIILDNINIIDSECSSSGGRFEAEIFDGSQPYFYILDQTDTLMMEDLPILNNGPHSIQGMDGNGCTTEIFNFDIIFTAPIELDVIVENQVSCFGGSDGKVNLFIDSNLEVTEYAWNTEVSNFQALEAGIYSLTVTNTDGCTASANFEITQPEELRIETENLENINDSECSSLGGRFEAEIFGGIQPYFYILDQIDTFLIDDLPVLNDGPHNIQGMDGNGCTTELINFDIIISEPISLDVVVENHVSCFGRNDGKVNLFIDSNLGVTEYAWNTEVPNFQTLEAGIYSLTVTNTDGCTASANFEITQPNELSIETENLVAAGNLAGSAEFITSGGTPPYEYNVNGVENTTGFFSLLQGDYEVIIADANGCSLVHDFTILFTSATEETNKNLNFAIYPNPTNDLLNIECNDCNSSSGFKIYNIEGKELMKNLLPASKQIDVSTLSKGFYFLKVDHKEKSSTIKFIVL